VKVQSEKRLPMLSAAVSRPCHLNGTESFKRPIATQGVVVMIQEMTRQANLDLLARTHLFKLACAQGSQPYIVPSYFAYNNNSLYSFSTVGQKIDWMRANPLVCVEADEVVRPQEWVSVIAFGRYEELPDTPGYQPERAVAYNLLQMKALWWEPGYLKTILHGTERPMVPVFYRIHLVQIRPSRNPLSRAIWTWFPRSLTVNRHRLPHGIAPVLPSAAIKTPEKTMRKVDATSPE
jgi:nitroimidazol reductase NimA-like FMN-containing flavoprotein (pyridoxamine 5'-phosphate oxidase superfamily)